MILSVHAVALAVALVVRRLFICRTGSNKRGAYPYTSVYDLVPSASYCAMFPLFTLCRPRLLPSLCDTPNSARSTCVPRRIRQVRRVLSRHGGRRRRLRARRGAVEEGDADPEDAAVRLPHLADFLGRDAFTSTFTRRSHPPSVRAAELRSVLPGVEEFDGFACGVDLAPLGDTYRRVRRLPPRHLVLKAFMAERGRYGCSGWCSRGTLASPPSPSPV